MCDERMGARVCPRDAVDTVATALLDDPARHLEAGRKVAGRYVVEAPLGQGSMGAVYAARRLCDDRRIALKVMSRGWVEGGTEGLRRFYHEAAIARRIHHSNLVEVIDFGVDDALRFPFLAMALVRGETLRAVVERRARIDLRTSACWLAQVAQALSIAHAAGIVHRDLKPENIMITGAQTDAAWVTVLDFGIAKVMCQPDAGRSTDLTASDHVVGTPRYMSPEQIMGDPIDGRADLYALGCLFHTLLEGREPFSAPNATSVMLKHVNAFRPVPSGLGDDDLSFAALRLHAALLARSPAQRPRSAAVVARAFRALAAGESGVVLDVLGDGGPSPETGVAATMTPGC